MCGRLLIKNESHPLRKIVTSHVLTELNAAVIETAWGVDDARLVLHWVRQQHFGYEWSGNENESDIGDVNH